MEFKQRLLQCVIMYIVYSQYFQLVENGIIRTKSDLNNFEICFYSSLFSQICTIVCYVCILPVHSLITLFCKELFLYVIMAFTMCHQFMYGTFSRQECDNKAPSYQWGEFQQKEQCQTLCIPSVTRFICVGKRRGMESPHTLGVALVSNESNNEANNDTGYLQLCTQCLQVPHMPWVSASQGI